MYHLGRAFLQGAALAQNWQTNKSWLAQAPGPKIPSANVKSLASTDTALGGMANPPSWESTWEGILVPLKTVSIPTSGSSSGLSSGAKAGIGIGVTLAVLGALGIAALFIWRRKRRNEQLIAKKLAHPVEIDSGYINEMGGVTYQPVEMTGNDYRNVRYKQNVAADQWEGRVLPVELPPDPSSATFR